ncbi:MAG: rhodanese-like domain-containing protein [Accumulibacter sp.]|jgi:rhodanese-related sulfurtransferase|uniref:rhodanese-like domain-containing protein n=1 Tax=Accumulibacter sp. TaxID=2053492 RepID=UPI002FC2FDE9
MNKFIVLVASVLFTALPAIATDKPNTPTSLAGGKVISVDEGKKLADDKSAQFFDTRNLVNFGKGHVPGAKAVSYKEKSDFKADFDVSVDSFEVDKLPADKAAKIVIYSDGPAGWKSYKAAVLAIKAGYKNVLWMRDGFAGWTAKSYPVE